MKVKKAGWLLFGALLMMCYAVSSAIAQPENNDPPRLLLLYGGCCHDWDSQVLIFTQLIESTGSLEVYATDDRDILKAENISGFQQVTIMTQGGGITPEQMEGMLGYVRDGGGLAVIHTAAGAFRESGAHEYFLMWGAKFRSHKYDTFEVQIEDDTHPITREMRSFEITDEDYIHDFYPESPINVLVRRTNDSEPVVWVRDYGKGRVYYNALGHDKLSWNNRHFQILLTRGIYWTIHEQARMLPFRRPLIP